MKIKLEENMPRRAVRLLSERGHDVATAAQEGLGGKNDATVARFANREGRMVMTMDRRFDDPYFNIFHAYRGQGGDDTASEEDAQLENNVTRALAITLQKLPPLVLTALLKNWLDCELPLFGSGGGAQTPKFYLQSDVSAVRQKLRTCKDIWVLGISASGQVTESKGRYGQRPDAWVFGNGWAVALEVKTGEGQLTEQQLSSYEEHIKRQTPEATTVKRLCKSWRRDIAPALGKIYGQLDISGVSGFLLEQLKEYLEMEGLGTANFVRTDFLNWDKRISTSALWGKMQTLSGELATHLGAHQLNRQNQQDDYIGYNLVHSDFRDKQPYDVPHWSLGLAHYERRLRLFVQCEGKELARRLASNRQDLVIPLAAALQPVMGDPRVQLRVEQKWLVMRSGKGERSPLYPVHFAFPLGDCGDGVSAQTVVRTALQAVHNINASNDRIANIQYLGKFKGKALIGVLQLEYSLNWFELEDLGSSVEDKLKQAALKMKDYYEVLRPYGNK